MSQPVADQVSQFFADMRERHAIYLRRQAGQPWPWTDDWVMQEYSITNPFRENDKTTRWLRTHVREPLRSKPEVLLAIATFRWFNRITTGEAIFSQMGWIRSEIGGITKNYDCETAWNVFLETGDITVLRNAITEYCGSGPYVTGSYIIQGWRGYNKLDGVLKCIENFHTGVWDFDANPAAGCKYGWMDVALYLLEHRGQVSLEQTWNFLRKIPYLGDFMAHEIVQDLRYTDLLCDAPDIMTWSNPGPGAERGLARIYGRDITGNIVSKTPKAQLIAEMRELLELSRNARYWPQRDGNSWVTRGYGLSNVVNSKVTDVWMIAEDAWPILELHQIEMWLCEFQKITKARTGEGRPRGKYRHK